MQNPATDAVEEFATWLRDVQAINASTVTTEELTFWRSQFDRAMAKGAEWRAQPLPARTERHKGEHRYAIAIEDSDGQHGLTFWIKRSTKGEIFLFYPREPELDPHASYHLDGTYHQKTAGVVNGAQKKQRLDAAFKGTEHLGAFSGHGAGPRLGSGSGFDDVFVVPRGSLSGRAGAIVVDVVEPGVQPEPRFREFERIVGERVYKHRSPWIVVAIASADRPVTR